MVAPNAEPPETPSTNGSASGLRRSACSATPTIESPAPASAARSTRGRRTSKTMS